MRLGKALGLILAAAAAVSAGACSRYPSGEEDIGFSGWTSQFTWLEPARVFDRAPVQSLNGPIDLGNFRRSLVVLNFWATWCAPCLKELPSLDRLQARLGGSGVEVVAVSVDRAGLSAVEPFFRRLGITHLAILADPRQQTAHFDKSNLTGAPFALYRMPITYVLAPDGRAIGYLDGAADWDSPAAIAFVERLAKRYAND